jgi:hypothetical protein
MEPAFSIFARAFRIEAPFMNEWLEHHLGLGFSTVYLCVAGRREKTAEEREFLLQRIAPEFLPRIRVLESPNHAGVENIYEQLDLGSLWDANERLLIIDIDEFLILQRHTTIQDFFQDVGGKNDGLFFEWVNYASDAWGYAGLANQMRDEPPWLGVNGKTMVRSGSVKKLKVHRHKFVRGARCGDVDIADAFLAHLCSRGFADIVCRILYGSVKTNDDDIALMREMLLEPTLPQNLPRRLILLYAQMLMARLDEHRAPLAQEAPRLRYGCDQETLDALVGSALGGDLAEQAEKTRRAMRLAKEFEVEFADSPEAIRDLGGFVAMCKRLRVARREPIGEGDDERVCYTVAAIPRDAADQPEPERSRWFRWIRRRK